MAERIALATGGTATAVDTGRVPDVGALLQADQGELGCGPEIGQIDPTGSIDGDTRVSIRGRNLWPGTSVMIGNLMAMSVEASSDGSVLSFDLPPGLPPGVSYDIKLSRPGSTIELTPAALPVIPTPDQLESVRFMVPDLTLILRLLLASVLGAIAIFVLVRGRRMSAVD